MTFIQYFMFRYYWTRQMKNLQKMMFNGEKILVTKGYILNSDLIGLLQIADIVACKVNFKNYQPSQPS
jgi:hypothetical protein